MEPNYHRFEEERAAQERLTRRHGDERYHSLNQEVGDAPYLSASPLECVGYVVEALQHDQGPRWMEKPATDQDLDDALMLLTRAREELDRQELELIDHARLRGRTWNQVGQSTGYGDRRATEQRYRRLRERTPGYVPLSADEAAAKTGVTVPDTTWGDL
ncbi:hypothetical protein EES39_38695 [Streptomyces sp. ADI92-24]|uniref:hypothetical protein n=1 Tax=Streptomyces sp. ADI92-24 TaxID=1522756 RepID=UPI000F558EAD|nr:hypothetical protein [Streptomyces sp. ADI92-24]RPK32419.1 hypothetical protein EES39_38695 [Streptomyces sp. ADI92-24]